MTGPLQRARPLVLCVGTTKPTTTHRARTTQSLTSANIFEQGRKVMDAVVRKMMNITDEMAATDAKK
eukprot:4109054-Pleurochrysis_carterae.AAC.1